MKKIKTAAILLITITILFSCRNKHEKMNCQELNQSDWKSALTETLPLMGHRNWIIIADAAFPLQSADGIKTIYCNDHQLNVVKAVMMQLKNSKHIKPGIFTDRELDFVTENQSAGVTGGNPQMIETIAKAAIATGADGLFIETHPNPAMAKSDGANMLKLDLLAPLLEKLIRIRKAIN